jgi:hypothetical protein
MYADHHVERVRDALLAVDGVQDVLASSAFKRVLVSSFDAKSAKPEQLEQALTAAGYAPDEQPKLPELPTSTADDSPWFRSTPRVTRTNLLDLEMSGDFRKW